MESLAKENKEIKEVFDKVNKLYAGASKEVLGEEMTAYYAEKIVKGEFTTSRWIINGNVEDIDREETYMVLRGTIIEKDRRLDPDLE
jgi:hypothetical protein